MSEESYEETLVRAMAKRKGISVDEARLYLEAVKRREGEAGLERLERFFKVLGASAGEISSMDADMKSWVSPVLGVYAMKALSGGESKKPDIEELAERLTIIKSVMGGGTEQIQQTIQDLNAKILDLTKEMAEKDREAILSQVAQIQENFQQQISTVTETLNSLAKIVEDMRKTPPATPVEKEGFVDRITKVQEELERFMRAAEALGFKIERPGERKEEKTIEEMKEELRRLGYEVRGPPSWDEIDRRLKEMREKVREEVEEELKTAEKKLTILASLGLSITNSLLSAFGRPELQKGFDVLRRAVKGGEGAVQG